MPAWALSGRMEIYSRRIEIMVKPNKLRLVLVAGLHKYK
jgi:hypothetical protein